MSEQRARRIVHARAWGVCEMCGQARSAEWQHRKNRSQGGRWDVVNGLSLCSPCHAYIHAHPEEAVKQGWTVLSHDDPEEQPVRLRPWCGDGWYLLTEDGMYQPTLPLE